MFSLLLNIIQLNRRGSERAIKAVDGSPSTPITQDSIEDYILLQNLLKSVERTCKASEVAEGEELKLVSFLSKLVSKTWHGIKDSLSSYVITLFLIRLKLIITALQVSTGCCRIASLANASQLRGSDRRYS